MRNTNYTSALSKSFTFGGFLPLLAAIECPSCRSLLDWASAPPGNFGFKLTSSFTTRQYGVMRSLDRARDMFLPFRRSSSAVSADILKKIPRVIGHVESALNFLASCFLIWPVVISLRFGTFRIKSSTRSGVGTNTFLPPICFCQLTETSITFGNLSTGFSSFCR